MLRASLPSLAVFAVLLLTPACDSAPQAGNDLGASDLGGTDDLLPPADLAPAPDLASAPVVVRALNGGILAAVHAGHAYYIGGDFTAANATPAPRLAALDTTGAVRSTCAAGAGFDSRVLALARSGNSLYAAGEFRNYQGQPARFVAKLDATTCALDTTFSPAAANGFDQPATSLLVANGALYVGGGFTAYRGVANSARMIAKLDLTSGALDTTFSPPAGNGFDNTVAALAASPTALYVGGLFTLYRGTGTAIHIAKLDLATGALDTTFSPPSSAGFDNTVLALAAASDALYVGGDFSQYRGAPAGRVAKLDLASGALDTTFSPSAAGGFDQLVWALAVQGGALHVGGDFTSYRGQSALRLARLDRASGALDTSFSPPAANGFDRGVRALATDGGALYVAGTFRTWRGKPGANFLCKLDGTTGALDLTFHPPGQTALGVEAPVSAVVVSGTELWAGGVFSWYGGQVANGIAKLDDASLALDPTFSPPDPTANGLDDYVAVLTVSGSALYAGGAFRSYRGIAESALRVAKLDLTTGALDTTFSPAGSANGFDSTVFALTTAGSALYAGGSFTAYRGVASAANKVAKLDLATGALDTTFSPPGANGFDSTVRALASSATSLYVGGEFKAYRGVAGSASAMAKLDLGSGALDTTFSPPGANGFDRAVTALAVAGTSVYAGGFFSAYRGVAGSAGSLAKLDLTSGTLDTTFSPPSANGFDGGVDVLTTQNSSLYVGGSFAAYRGVTDSAHGVAKLDLVSGGLDTTFSPPAANGTDGAVTALALGASDLFVGGYFTTYRGTPAQSLVLVDATSGAIR